MGNVIRKVNLRQFVWGVVAGVITVALMAVSYKVGLDQEGGEVEGEKNILAEEFEEREIYISVRSDCSNFEEEVIIEEGRNIKKYCASYVEGESAFDVMKKLVDEDSDFSFGYDENDYGVFITSINNYHPDIESKFWSFLVNGEMSMVGVRDYTVSDGDDMLFKIEEVSF